MRRTCQRKRAAEWRLTEAMNSDEFARWLMMKRVWTALLLGWLLIGCAAEKNAGVASPSSSGHVFDITAYGAVDDPKVPSTDAFRQAIAD